MDTRNRSRFELIDRAAETLCRLRRAADEDHFTERWIDGTPLQNLERQPCGECQDLAALVHDDVYEEVLLVPASS